MSVGALKEDLTTFERCQHTGKRVEAFQVERRFALIPEQFQQRHKAFGRLAGAEQNLTPLFETMWRGMPAGQPPVDVVERNAEQHLARGGICPLLLVGHQIV